MLLTCWRHAGRDLQYVQIFQSLVRVLQIPVADAVQMLSETPAKIAKIDHNVGSLVPGKRAGILISSFYEVL